VTCALLLVLAYGVMVRTGWGQRLDDGALTGRTTHESVVGATDRLLNTISVTSLAVAAGVIVLIALVRRRPHLALVSLGVIVGANVTTELLKRALSRPDLAGGPDPLGGASFPSGHTTVAMSLAVAVVLISPARHRVVAGLLGFTYAALVGAGTVTAGWHRPSDVAAGYLVAVGWGALGALAVLIWRGAVPTRGMPRDSTVLPPVLLGIAIVALVIGFFGFGVVIVAERQGRLDAVVLDESYGLALVAVIGAGLLLMTALVVALHNADLDPTHDEARAGFALA
jgi:membrane-associated phospholipid phosphatase